MKKIFKKLTIGLIMAAIATVFTFPVQASQQLNGNEMIANTKAVSATVSSALTSSAGMKTFGQYTGTQTFSFDMTHDGKADTVKIAVSKGSSYYFNNLKIYINGKLAKKETGLYSYSYSVQYLKYSKSKEFLYVYGTGDDNSKQIQHVYSYNNKTKKLSIVCDLTKYSGSCGKIASINKSKGTFKVNYGYNSSMTGHVYWSFTYKYNSGINAFKIVKTTAKAKISYSGYYATYDPDGLTKYFNKSMVKTAKKVVMYTNTSLRVKAFTVPKGKFVKLKKICSTYDGTLFAQYKYGSKYGWIQINKVNDYRLFQGLDKRMAAGMVLVS